MGKKGCWQSGQFFSKRAKINTNIIAEQVPPNLSNMQKNALYVGVQNATGHIQHTIYRQTSTSYIPAILSLFTKYNFVKQILMLLGISNKWLLLSILLII